MEQALLNTVMGMSIVFAALIFISFCIYLLKYIPKLMDFLADKFKKEEPAKPEEVKKEEPPVSKSTITKKASKKDDTELAAVIAAAIAAVMSEQTGQEVSADGLIIRKIKRR